MLRRAVNARAESEVTRHLPLTPPALIQIHQAPVIPQVPVIPVATAILLPVMTLRIARILERISLQRGQAANQRATLVLEPQLIDLYQADDYHYLLQLQLRLLVVRKAAVEAENKVTLHRVEGETCDDHRLSRTVVDPAMIHHRHILHLITVHLPVDVLAVHLRTLVPALDPVVRLPLDIAPSVLNHLEIVMVEGLGILLLRALLVDDLQAAALVERAVEVLAEAVVVV